MYALGTFTVDNLEQSFDFNATVEERQTSLQLVVINDVVCWRI